MNTQKNLPFNPSDLDRKETKRRAKAGVPMPVAPTPEPQRDVARYAKLSGKFKHYCPDWDFMAIDETCPEWSVCRCLSK